jgi:hypothetical protein
MTFTYGGDPSANSRDAVRTLLSDTDAADPLLTDEVIAWLLTDFPDARQAARAGAEIIAGAASKAAVVQKRIGDLSLSYSLSERAVAYRALAAALASQASRVAAPTVWAAPDSLLDTADRTTGTGTDFSVGMFDTDGVYPEWDESSG